jgi:hypothetical protein
MKWIYACKVSGEVSTSEIVLQLKCRFCPILYLTGPKNLLR